MKRVAVLAAFLWGAGAASAQPGYEATSPTALGQYQTGGQSSTNYSLAIGAPSTYTETIGGASIPEAGTVWSQSVVLKASVHGTDTDVTPSTYLHRIRVECRPISEPLIGVYTHEGLTTEFRPDATANFSDTPTGGDTTGRTSSVTITGLLPGVAYHWQAMSWKT